MASRFSTVALSHMASERMSLSRPSRARASSASPLERSTSALPEMAVSGVRRSCEIDLRRFALSCSFFAMTAAFSRSSSRASSVSV